ncbi:UNKNOWN [Stylonychia lemnae]|uniref:Uncharacterized protein n=1 Tax=Stylonychia lemnae TaxID=5949 RepID=A0A078AX38_STYLE|nr:UNKNOWN [Stylonychia lemnae]|eukprot:CDW85817.1 UNKNOWN [Stylonychia lemnae]
MMMLFRKTKIQVEIEEGFFDNFELPQEQDQELQTRQKKIASRQVRQATKSDRSETEAKQEQPISAMFDPRNITRLITTPRLKQEERIQTPDYMNQQKQNLQEISKEQISILNEVYQSTQNVIGEYLISDPDKERLRSNMRKINLYEDTNCKQAQEFMIKCLEGKSDNNCEKEQMFYLYCMNDNRMTK